MIAERFDHLDVLVNNVGGIFPKRLVSEDGYEMSLAVNFLAPFVVTETLLPLLIARPSAARCVNVVSSSFQMTKGDPFADIQAEKDYVGIYVHARAKLFTLLWSIGLSERAPGGQLIATAVNPGMAWTSDDSVAHPRSRAGLALHLPDRAVLPTPRKPRASGSAL